MRMENGRDGTATVSRPEQEHESEPLRRADVYPDPVVDGGERPDGAWIRLLDLGRGLLTSRAERDEAELEGRLRAAGSVTRCNTIAVLSPKGGVGKTTCTFLLGNTLASHLNLRCLAIDADPDFGTLGSLAREDARTERSIADLVEEMDRVTSAAELRRYVSAFPSGLHVLAAPSRAELMAAMSPEHYGALTAFLGRFYDVLLLDLVPGSRDRWPASPSSEPTSRWSSPPPTGSRRARCSALSNRWESRNASPSCSTRPRARGPGHWRPSFVAAGSSAA